jgi:hypothetical protein
VSYTHIHTHTHIHIYIHTHIHIYIHTYIKTYTYTHTHTYTHTYIQNDIGALKDYSAGDDVASLRGGTMVPVGTEGVCVCVYVYG